MVKKTKKLEAEAKTKTDQIKTDITDKTQETQEKIKEKTDQAKTDITDKTQETQEKIKEKMEDSNLTREDLKANAEKVQSQAEKMLQDIISTFKGKQEEFGKTISSYTTVTEKPLVDLIETEEKLILKVDVPNRAKEDVVLEVTDDSLDIKIQFEEDDESEDINYIIKERSKGKIERIIKLPTNIDTETVTARFDGSVLIVDIPKIMEPRFKVDIN